MDKAKEAIMKSFNNNESKYNEVFVIIDNRWNCQLHRPLHAAGPFLNPEFYYANPLLEFDLEVTNGLYECIKRLVPSREVQQKILIELPIYKASGGLFGTDFAISQRNTLAPAQWWRMYGHSAPNLQQLAIRILSLTCSASGCERNWSVFEQKRNRLEHKRLHDLVFVKYNQALKQRYNVRDEIDPTSLNDIDECNEWLVGEMEDDNTDDAGNELVFEDDTLNWEIVYRASGAGELRTYTRQQARKRKEPSSGATSTTSKTSIKGKEIVVNEDELEFEDLEELEKEEEINFEETEGEEEGGYASLDDNENDDYIGEEASQASQPKGLPSQSKAKESAAAQALDYVDIPNSQIRKVTDSRLLLSKQTIPHYYLTVDTNNQVNSAGRCCRLILREDVVNNQGRMHYAHG
ncbi:hypothetical protein Cni_G10397 [Canna indica]|uniref:HAT C-terminal dimerisation domain-containing protein n=1 Tax=Canna indica TaxID=4628 RepID=A0AAQ3QAL8_9LILI|nr:hypothetical protein Cni_G10397 [Canna indica]